MSTKKLLKSGETLISYGSDNIIEKIKVNGMEINVDSDKSVDIDTKTDIDALDYKIKNHESQSNGHKTKLMHLKDVAIENPIANQVLVFDDSVNKWVNSSIIDGRVKLDNDSESKLLKQWLDDNTFVIENNTIIAKSLKDMDVTIEEVNFLKGIDYNIKQKFDSIGSGIVIKGIINTVSDLPSNAQNGDTYIVRSNEEGKSATYSYIESELKFIKIADIDLQMRDFTINPINLETEVTGKLSKIHIDDDVVTKDDLGDYLDKQTFKSTIYDGSVKKADVAKNLDGLQHEVGDINNVVDKFHEFTNTTTLDKFSEDEHGNPLYNGEIIGGESVVSWSNIQAKPFDIIDDTVFNVENKKISIVPSILNKIHKHENKEDILDKLNIINGELSFDGKLVDKKIINWLPTHDYVKDEIVVYNNSFYIALDSHTSTTSFNADESKWKLIVEVKKFTIDQWTENYDFYNVDDYVTYNGNIYKCKTKHISSTTFDNDKDKWELWVGSEDENEESGFSISEW